MSDKSVAYLIQKAFKQIQYIDGQQEGDTPNIERAAMSALRDLRSALRELGAPIPSYHSSNKPHSHSHGRRGFESHAHRDLRNRRRG